MRASLPSPDPTPHPFPVGLLCLLAGGIVTAACDSAGEADRDLVTVRDSAGVTIVESAAPASQAPLTVDPEPLLSIGVAEGDEPYLLSRVADAALLPDGRVALLDGASRQLRVYDSGGRFLAAFGRSGDGPGEFRQAAAPLLVEPDGGVRLWDSQLRRITRVGPELTLRGTFPTPTVTGTSRALLRGWYGDGSMLLEARPPANVSAGAFRDTLHLHRGDGEGETHVPLARVPGRSGELNVISTGPGGEVQSFSIGYAPLGPTPQIAVSDTLLFTGSGDRFEVTAVAPDGRVAWIARPGVPPRPVGPAEREAFVEDIATRSPDPDAIRAAWRDRPLPATLPPFDRFVVDTGGRLWIRSHVMPLQEAPARWHILDGEGVWVADVELPAELQVTRITEDAVLGIHRDDLGVESVRLYRWMGG